MFRLYLFHETRKRFTQRQLLANEEEKMIENGRLVKASNVLVKEFSREEAGKMNVKRYCLLAQLSRPTFYAYYGSLPQLVTELLVKQLEVNFVPEHGGYNSGLNQLLLYMSANRNYFLHAISFIKDVQCRQTGRKKGEEFAIMLPDKVREAILRVTRNYVAEHSKTGDYSNKMVRNAADLIYATLYEWINHGMRDDQSEIVDRWQIAVQIIEDQIRKTAVGK